MVAVAADEGVPAERRVDPHLWGDAMRERGFGVQLQPSSRQSDGSVLPSTVHLTVTPVTAAVVDELLAAAADAADAVRGAAHLDGLAVAAALLGDAAGALLGDGVPAPDSVASLGILEAAGLLDDSGLDALAPVLALVETLPPPLVERLLIELLAAGLEH